ncbi:MAG: hypothetical protein HQM14_17315 [SAR324 cluster bacterium]|nr:hypothetical protein [SAR324 cluster bacterium]
MKKIILGFIILFWPEAFLFTVQAQVNISNILATNVNADNAIIELNLPMELDGRVYVFLVWVTSEGKQAYLTHVAKGGKQLYEMRHHPEWRGPLKLVATNVNEARGSVRQATFLDEIELFLVPERLMPATINMLNKNTLFMWSWNHILLVVLAISALIFFIITKKHIVMALVFGFVIAWSMMDLRKMYDHFMIAQHIESQQITVPKVLEDLKVFLHRAGDIIGPNSWKTEDLGVLFRHFAEYKLAEHEYLPYESPTPPDFIITSKPKNREVAWEYKGYYLVKGKNKP